MKDLYYRQCRLKKKDGTEQVSYIPEPFCVLGKTLKLKEHDGWSDGWKVTFAGERRSAQDVDKQNRDYLKNRKASDI